MKREELTALIDRVIGSKGILRTPAYWMRRVLNKMSDYADESLESVKELIAVNAQETATLLDEKSDVYDLPDAGTYALDSTEGQKLLKALNNSKKMLLRRRIEGSTYIDFLTLEASIYNVQGDPQTLILSNLSNPKFVYVNNALTSVDFKRFLGYISLSDDSITVTYSDFLESSIPITNTIDNLESDSTTAALSANQGRVLKEYVDSKSYPKYVTSAESLEMIPNAYYVFEGNTISLSLADGQPDKVCEYVIKIVCVGNPNITLPSNIVWANDVVPQFVDGKTYVISIIDGLAVFAEFTTVS